MANHKAISPSNLSSSEPPITLPNTLAFTNERTKVASDYFTEKLKDLNNAYAALLEEANLTELVYNSSYAFLPIIGKYYYLYTSQAGTTLSILSPDDWNTEEKRKTFITAVTLTIDSTWRKV